MTFSDRLRLLREEKFLTQNDLAKMLNISRQSISNYESGTRFPNDVQILIKLSQIFSVSVDYLVGISNIRSPAINNNIVQFPNNKNVDKRVYECKNAVLESLFYEVDTMPLDDINKLIKFIYVYKGRL
ncbi:MAG: helix-turn-helix transcriptional regulator [Tissierellaceae bacterium]